MHEAVVNLLWHPQAQFAGLHVAEQHALGAPRGLGVRTTPFVSGVGPVATVLAGNAQFGIASPSHILKSGRADELVLLAVVQQDSALVYPAHRGRGILALADLAGRRIAVWPGNEDLELRWMLHRAGVPLESVTREPMGDTVAAFVAGTVDCAQMTVYHELHRVEAAGLAASDLRLFRASENGSALIKDGLFTTRALADQSPAFVQAMVDTFLEGWTRAFADPAMAIEACLARGTNLVPAEQARQLEDIQRLARCGATLIEGLGYPDPQHCARAAAALADLGQPTDASLARACADERFWRAAPAEWRRPLAG